MGLLLVWPERESSDSTRSRQELRLLSYQAFERDHPGGGTIPLPGLLLTVSTRAFEIVRLLVQSINFRAKVLYLFRYSVSRLY